MSDSYMKKYVHYLFLVKCRSKHNEILSHTCENDLYQKDLKKRNGGDFKILGEDVNCCYFFVKQCTYFF